MSVDTDTGTQANYREVWASPIFRAVVVTRSLGTTADTLRTVALSVLIFISTGSPLLGAMTYGIAFIPQLLGSSLLGAVADRVRPRTLITTGYAGECALAVVLGSVRLPTWACLLSVAGISFLTPVFLGSAGRLVADVLAGDAYVLGRSLLNMASSASQLLGLAGGGVAAGALGPRHALLIGAALHALAAGWSRRQLPATSGAGGRRAGAGQSVIRGSWQGNKQMLADRTMRTLFLIQWLPCMLMAGAESLVIPYSATRGFGHWLAGPLLACLPSGMILGDLLMARCLGPGMRERMLIPAIALLGLPLVVFAWTPSPYVAAALLFASGGGYSYGLGVQRRFREATPAESRGQAFALLSTGLMTLQGLGPVLAGSAAGFMPVGSAMAVSGIAIAVLAVIFSFQWPRVSRLA